MKLLNWLRKLHRIVRTFDIELAVANARVRKLEQILKERTDAHVDISFRGGTDVILVGRHRNTDFVKVYRLPNDAFSEVHRHLQELSKYTHRGRVDAPIQFSAVIEDSLKEW